MVCVQHWGVWFWSLLAVFGFSVTHALTVKPYANNDGLSTLQQQQNLDKRAPSRKDYTPREQQLCRSIAKKIDSILDERDVIYFVGNSGAYIGYAFDKTKYNMKETPASNTRQYGTLGGQNSIIATRDGAHRYFDKVLSPTLEGKEIGRIILVDHSGSGKSVDGFYLAFLDAAYAYKGIKEMDAGNEDWDAPATTFRQYYEAIPWYLINIVDFDRRPDGSNPAIPPRYVQLLDTITVGKSGELNSLVGDSRSHPRVTPDYPPTKWEIPIKDCWEKDEEKLANDMKKSIINYNKKHGGLIGSPKKINPTAMQIFFSGFPGLIPKRTLES